MAKRTTGTSGRTGGEGAAPKRAAPRKTTAKKAAPKRATRQTADEEPAPKRPATKPRRPSRVSGLGTALRDGANKILAKADDEAVKAILTAGALAAAAVILGDKVGEDIRDGGIADTPAKRDRLKAAAAAGGAAMGAQLLKTLDETRERKGLATGDEGFDPKALAVKAVAAFIK